MKNNRTAAVNRMLVDFGTEVVQIYKNLVFEQKEFILSKRLLKSGTVIEAYYSLGNIKQSYVKAVETNLWMQLLLCGNYCRENQINCEIRNASLELKKLICELEKLM